jgi:two-component system response regulator HydG
MDALVGSSRALLEVGHAVELSAASRTPVLLRGECGTGKTLAARMLHALSDRAAGPFEIVRCAAWPDAALESALFGCARGAAEEPGLLETASGGTVLLTGIDDTSVVVQTRLLRLLEDGEISRLGDARRFRTDVRLLAETRSDLLDLVREGQFRSDLYYRLTMVTIHIPPLRERKEDIPALADHFIRKFSRGARKPVTRVAPEALVRLLRHDWPGNVRELERVLERAVLHGAPPAIRPSDIRRLGRGAPAAPAIPLKEMERRQIQRALWRTGHDLEAAALLLGIALGTLHRKIASYGLAVDGDPSSVAAREPPRVRAGSGDP